MKRHKRMNRRMTSRLKSTVSVLLASSMVLNPLNGIQIAIGSELNSTRVTVKGSKAGINLSSAALREAASYAIQNGVTFTPEAYVGLDTATDAAFENLLTQGSGLYELDLFDAEDQDVFNEAGIDVKLLIQKDPKAADADFDTEIASASNLKRKTNVSFDYQAKTNKGKEILFYQKGSPLDSLIANFMLEDINHADLSEAEVAEDNSSYALTGSETVTILYMNTDKIAHTFSLSVDGKAFSGSVKVEGNESAVSKLKKQFKQTAKEELTGTTEATAEVTETAAETEATKANTTETAAVDQDNVVTTEAATKAEETTTAADSTESAADAESTTAAESTAETTTTEAATEAVTKAEAQTEELSQEETTAKETAAQMEKEAAAEVKAEEATKEVEQLTKNTVTAIGSFTLQRFFDEAESQEVKTAEKADAAEVKTEEKTEAKEEENTTAAEKTAEAEKTTEAEKQTEAAKEETTAAEKTTAAEETTVSQEETTTAAETTAESKETTAAETEATTEVESTSAAETTAATTAAAETEESKTTESKAATAMDESLAAERAQLLSEQTVEALAENTVSAKAVQYTLDDLTSDFKSVDLGAYLVKVYPVADNAIEADWTLKATELLKDGDEAKTETAETMKEETAEALKNAGIYENSASLDIHFEDADGKEVEPNGKVRVEIEVAKEALDETATSLSVYHVEEKNGSIQEVKALDTTTQALDENGETIADSKATVTETVENTEAVAVVAETEDETTTETPTTQTVEKFSDEVAKVKTQFTVDSFSTFTITWGNSVSTLKIITEDENGDELQAYGQSSIKLTEGETYYFDEDDNHFFVPNYAVANAYYEDGEANVEVRSAALVENKVVLYDNDDRKVTDGTSLTVHLQYRDDVAPNIMAVSEDGNSAAPTHHKYLELNNDGTYTLSLDVTGKSLASESTEKANVIIVFDRSSSMKSYVECEGTPQGNSGTYYGVVENRYVELNYSDGKWYYSSGKKKKEYNGNKFYKTRLSVAQGAMSALTDTLVESVENLYFIDFAGSMTNNKLYQITDNNIETQKNEIKSQIASNKTSTGTNWEAALQTAKSDLETLKKSSENPCYVIFVSDGNPSTSNSNSGDQYNDSNTQYYTDATDEANYIVNTLKAELYTVGVFGNATKMQNLAKDAYKTENYDGTEKVETNYYSAADSDDLNKAFADIAKKITKAENYADVKITDVLTKDTKIDASSFTYKISDGTTTYEITLDANGNISTINGSESTIAEVKDSETGKTYTYQKGDVFPAASYDSGDRKITWDLSDYKGSTFGLPDGWTYTVMFKVWPNQTAYDNAADWKNGTKTYSADTDGVAAKGYVKDGNSYKLKSNSEAEVKYKTVEYETGKDPEYSDEMTSAYEEFPTMDLTAAPITITKVWSDDGTHSDEVVTMRLTITNKDGGTTTKDIELTSSESWTKTWYLATGLNDGNTNLDAGYTYTISELKVIKGTEDVADQYTASFKLNNTDVTTASVKPMLVKSTTDIKDVLKSPAVAWTSSNQVTATNTPIRTLIITKTVTGTGASAANDGYTFTVDIKNTNGELTNEDKALIAKLNNWASYPETVTVTLKPSSVGTTASSDPIYLPYGYQYKITEDKTNCSNYETTVVIQADGEGDQTIGGTTECTGMTGAETLTKNTTVAFTNKLDLQPPTGIRKDILPYVISMGIALAGAAMLLLELQRKRRMSE